MIMTTTTTDHDHDHGKGDADGDKGGHHHHHGDADPHAWQNLANGARYARNVAEGLAAADPAHADAYRQRALAYGARIETGRRDPSDLRRDSRRAPQGRHLARRIRLLRRRLRRDVHRRGRRVHRRRAVGRRRGAHHRTGQRERVPAVFVENITSPRLVQQIARETGAKVGGTLYSDALSKPGQPGATYLEMFEWNARQLAAALQP